MTKLTEQQQTIIVMALMMSNKISKRQKRRIFVMFSNPEITGSTKRLKCKYDKPGNYPELIVYWRQFVVTARAHTLFSTLTTMLDSCDDAIDLLDTKQQLTLTGNKGKAAERDSQYLTTDIQMDLPLGVIQTAINGMTEINAIALIEHFLLTVDARQGHGPTIDAAYPGEMPGTIVVTNVYVDSTTSYLRMISPDREKWYVGDFGKKTRGIISDMDEKPLTPRMLYYVKCKTDGKDGKSAYGPIFEVYAG